MSKTPKHHIKLPPGIKKVKPTTLSYLYEIAVIPESIKAEYLQKLLKRKSASTQKNVKLLNIIYFHIREDRMLEWDDESVCKMLNISKNMLYCHKSRLLKSLRLAYFGWEKIEDKEFNTSPKRIGNENSLMYEKASRMYKIGMKKEAKNEFLKLEKILTAKHRTDLSEKLIFIKILKQLSRYYYLKMDSKKFNLYHKKFEGLRRRLIKNKAAMGNPELQFEILLSQSYIKKYRLFLKVKGNRNYNNALEIIDRIISLFEKYRYKYKDSCVLTLLNRGVLNQDLHNYEGALKDFIKCEKFCRKHNLVKEAIIPRIHILRIELITGRSDFEHTLTEIIKCYEQLKGEQIEGFLKEAALFQFACVIASRRNNNLFYKVLSEYNSYIILTNGYHSALRTLYFMKFSLFMNKVRNFRLESYGREEIPVVYSTDKKYEKKLINIVNEVSQNFRKMKIFFKKESLLNILEAEFWKGTELNYLYARYLIKEISWLFKFNERMLDSDALLFEILKLCISIIEDSKHLTKDELLTMYEQKFKELSGKIKNDADKEILTPYSIFSYTAQITGYRELKEIAAEVYKSLKSKYPEAFQPVLDNIRKSEKDNGEKDEAEIRMEFAA